MKVPTKFKGGKRFIIWEYLKIKDTKIVRKDIIIAQRTGFGHNWVRKVIKEFVVSQEQDNKN